MTDAQFKDLQASMPWRQHDYLAPKGQVIIQMIDKFGREVPLLTLVAFMVVITEKLAIKSEKENENAQTTASN